MKYGNKGDMSGNSKGQSEAPVTPGLTKDSSYRGAEADCCTPAWKPSIDLGGSNESMGKKGQT